MKKKLFLWSGISIFVCILLIYFYPRVEMVGRCSNTNIDRAGFSVTIGGFKITKYTWYKNTYYAFVSDVEISAFGNTIKEYQYINNEGKKTLGNYSASNVDKIEINSKYLKGNEDTSYAKYEENTETNEKTELYLYSNGSFLVNQKIYKNGWKSYPQKSGVVVKNEETIVEKDGQKCDAFIFKFKEYECGLFGIKKAGTSEITVAADNSWVLYEGQFFEGVE